MEMIQIKNTVNVVTQAVFCLELGKREKNHCECRMPLCESICHSGKIVPVKLKTDSEYISWEKGRLLSKGHTDSVWPQKALKHCLTPKHLSASVALPAIL